MDTPEFRLNEFKGIAKWIRDKFPGPIAFFLNGWLWALEELWIDAKVQSSVEAAIAPHRPPEPSISAPTQYTEESEVEGLDIIGFTYDFSNVQEVQPTEEPH